MTKTNAQPDDLASGRRLRAARLSIGVTQAQLGAEVGVSYQQIQKYEAGANRIAISRLMTLARALRVSPLKLLGFDLSFGSTSLDEAITAVDERIRAIPADRRAAALRSIDKVLDAFEGAPTGRRQAAA